MLATQRSSASLCLLRPARSAVVRLRSTASTRPPPSPSPESPPSHLSCQPPPPPPPPPSFLDKKDELHELELLHQPTFPQTLPSLKAYHRIHDEEMHTHPIPSTPLYRYDVGYEARFDTLHPPILPPIDSAEVGSGDYDQRMEQSQLDPAQLPDPTNRVPHHALRFLEDVGYVTAVRASFMAFLSSLAPAADVLAQGSVEVDVGGLAEGVTRTVKWRGKPVFIRHRTAQDIAHAKRDDELVAAGADEGPAAGRGAGEEGGLPRRRRHLHAPRLCAAE